MFDALEYFKATHGTLKATKNDFKFCRVSSTTHLEEILTNNKRTKRFFAVDDSQEGESFRGAGATWFERRPITVFLLRKLGTWPDMDGREAVLKEMRPIFRQIVSRINYQSEYELVEGLEYMDKSAIPFNEVPGYFAGGAAGIYFTVTIDLPIDMTYNPDEWTK